MENVPSVHDSSVDLNSNTPKPGQHKTQSQQLPEPRTSPFKTSSKLYPIVDDTYMNILHTLPRRRE